MTDFAVFVTWMTANLSGYAKYIEAGSVAAYDDLVRELGTRVAAKKIVLSKRCGIFNMT